MSQSMMVAATEQQIFEAFRQCSYYDRSELMDRKIRDAALEISKMQPIAMTFPNSLKRAGRTTINSELSNFATSVNQANKAFRGFHEETFQMLADAHIIHPDIEKAIGYLLYVAEVVGAFDLEAVSTIVPRGKHKVFGAAVARVVKYYFEMVFERRATVTNGTIDSQIRGQYKELLERIYRVLGVETRDKSKPGWVSVGSMADAACDASPGK